MLAPLSPMTEIRAIDLRDLAFGANAMQIRGLETKRHAREISVQRMTAKFALMGAVRRLRRGDPATVPPAMTGDETMTRTFFAALIALTATSGLAAAQLSAKAKFDSDVVIVDATGEHTRPNLFDQIRDTAPRTTFDQVRDSAPHSPFDQIGTMAP